MKTATAPRKPGGLQNLDHRLRRGRDERKRVGRKSVAELHPKNRRFDPIELLLKNTGGRVPRLLPLKYARMAVSPFAFFRGAVSIMAADLAAHPYSSLFAQLCGDAHVQNMGSFGGPDGRIIFDLNDFDETIYGPWEWDVKRMATSLVLAGTESGHTNTQCITAAESFLTNYCALIGHMAQLPVLEMARYQTHRAKKAGPVSDALKQAERASPADLIGKYTHPTAKAGPRFKRVQQILWPVGGERKRAVLASLALYENSLEPERLHLFRRFRPVDVAFKVVGTGSVGLRDYVVLMEGNGPADPLFLQVKQEIPSAYAGYLKEEPARHQGRRVAEGQRSIQPLSDPLLGWTQINGLDYLVRQLNDHKGHINVQELDGEGLHSLAGIAGELLARGHARSGDAAAIKGYIGQPDTVIKKLAAFASKYANQTQADFEEFTKAVKKGRIKTA